MEDLYGKEGCCKTCSMTKRNAHRTDEPDPTHPGLNKCKCDEWICAKCINKKDNGQGCKAGKI